MADSGQFNADQLAFWNGPGGRSWVEQQKHADITIAAGRGLEEAVVQPTQIGAVNSWLRPTGGGRYSRHRVNPRGRWRRIWTARACACPVRCGWSAARLSAHMF
jgi:hypothetical protein